ncbi:MAG: class I SAM-dependent methyltransferase [Gammaproteobacteria bacterium]|nr:class I SAM-dependent methyltransferase [Gammaproteobacteria bacterium]MDE0367493.1 class I SAM-dependent methyltransferase [Gammaproteobacteria bacterium]
MTEGDKTLLDILDSTQRNRIWQVQDAGARLTAEVEPNFLVRPDPGYGEWITRRLLKETLLDISEADRIGKTMHSSERRRIMSEDLRNKSERFDEKELVIGQQQVMQAWEYPIMSAMAEAVTRIRGDVLEIGFGMGISASLIQQRNPRSHTIVECHADIQERFKEWRSAYPGRKIHLLEGRWQDVNSSLDLFDGVLFDAYPLNAREWSEHYVGSITYAHHFFETAAEHLRPGGVFTYYSNEVNSMSRAHQRALLELFGKVSISNIKGLKPPPECYYWQCTEILMIEAVK